MLCPFLKSLIVTIYIAVLLILALSVNKATAQENLPSALQVGQAIPEPLWNNPLVNIPGSGRQDNILFLQDFKGKPIIIDFWASWCGPCLKNMPVLDSIHHANKSALQVIMMNASSSRDGHLKERAFIREFLDTHKSFITPLVLRNDTYRKYFVFSALPHYIWIGPDGKIKAVTDHKSLSPANIKKLISGEDLNLTLKIK